MSVRIGWAVALVSGLLACGGGGSQNSPPAAGGGGELEAPVPLPGDFQVTLWGDAEGIQVDDKCTTLPRPDDPDGQCICISSTPRANGWGAVYWQTRRETGVRRAVTVRQATKLTFWARGEQGGEKVHFHLAGAAASELLQPVGMTELSPTWERFELELKDRKMEQITGLFGVRWSHAGGQNSEGLKFYLDDIRYE